MTGGANILYDGVIDSWIDSTYLSSTVEQINRPITGKRIKRPLRSKKRRTIKRVDVKLFSDKINKYLFTSY
jgi:hypothetical protein